MNEIYAQFDLEVRFRQAFNIVRFYRFEDAYKVIPFITDSLEGSLATAHWAGLNAALDVGF